MSFIIAILCVLATCWGDYVADEILIKLPYGTAGSFGTQSMRPLSQTGGASGWHKVTLAPGEAPDEAIARLKGMPGVEAVQKNFIYYKMATPDDTHYASQQATYMQTITLDSAWDSARGSANIVIAVIDTGVDITHEDLADNIWTNPDEIAGNGIDDDGNGVIDDVNGATFSNPSSPTNNVLGSDGHGTFVAGIAAGKGFNAKGITGAAPGCTIMPIRADNGFGGFTTASLVSALSYAVTEKASVINLSLGGSGTDPAFESAISSAANAGITIIAAAGNNGVDIDTNSIIPAIYSTTIAVGATNQAGTSLESFSNFGNSIDVVAPGRNLYSTQSTNAYASDSGTSYSAPLVAGIAGLLLSIHASSDIRSILHASSKDLGDAGKDTTFGYGLVDAAAALLELARPSFSLGSLESGDSVDLNGSFDITIDSGDSIVTSSISISVTTTSGTSPITISSFTPLASSAATYNNGTLTISPSAAGLSAGSATFTISATNGSASSLSATTNFTLTLTSGTTNSLELRGPEDGLPIITSPNPYDPRQDGAMIVAIHTNLSATAKIHIYSPHFNQVASFTRSLATGYNEITWTPTADLGSGVYFLIVDATADNGSTALKRHRFAIMPR